MRLRLALPLAVAALALVPAAGAGSGLRVSLMGQSHTALAGSPWAYYLRVWQNGKPWYGAIDVQVVDQKGKKIDGIGLFAFKGSWLRAYIWRRAHKGQALDLRIAMLAGTKVIDTVSYRVALQ